MLTSKRSKNLCPPSKRIGIPSLWKAFSSVRDKAVNRTKELVNSSLGKDNRGLTKNGKISVDKKTTCVSNYPFDLGRNAGCFIVLRFP